MDPEYIKNIVLNMLWIKLINKVNNNAGMSPKLRDINFAKCYLCKNPIARYETSIIYNTSKRDVSRKGLYCYYACDYCTKVDFSNIEYRKWNDKKIK